MGTFGKPVNTSSQTQLKRSQLYSTANVHNKSTSNLGSGSMNMKAHLSKKMIKNYVKTNREKDHMGMRYEIEKNGNQKRLNTYAKTAAQRENNGAKRPKSTLDNAPTFQGGSNTRKVPKTYQSPSGIADESRKTKVKVYKLEKNKIVSEIEDRRKHLKSKSQSNFSSQHAVDHKAKKLRNSKIKKTDIYSQNFMSNELQKSSGIRENASKITSPGSENKKSPMRTVSNFQQMNKVIKKVNNTMKNSRSHYTRKAGTERELNKNHSLIAESGCSGFFGNNKNKELRKEHSGSRVTTKPSGSKDPENRMNFYPSPPDEVDFDSLEFQEQKEEFKITRLKNKIKERSSKMRSPDISKDHIPEYYFDLSKIHENNGKMPKIGGKERIKSYQLYKR